ncbi:hypothetical protein PAECIP111891_04224 [Paenibacillus allorhizoplanae]|uniref:HNH endonuclease n=1 Tax=Paenibacillus allorhizoplanae TaxID=2905648 RepID=A0ABN8GXS7_9BACL|nr:hypothetical protein [Paenibacillus allorhizoplanae]CAH1215181.1 hypothetical protein PAECIP111891_04224 [Paenibacillus allorhizoplanae]
MTRFRTAPVCNFPECTAVGRKTWALLPLCLDHHETIRLETLKYYANRMPYEHRQYYLQIARLIKRITPLNAQTVTKNGVLVNKGGVK